MMDSRHGPNHDQQEGEAIQEDERERGAHREVALANDGKGEERVVAEARGQRPGQIGPEAHKQRGNDGGEDRANDEGGRSSVPPLS